MKYKNFTLDPFQEESISYVNKGNSVVVSAATGTGKTLIADYVIDKFLKLGKKIVYTAPIKALSNQKYRDFKKEYGAGAVGIMTGDIVINPEAQVLIMTTEIYRNMLLVNDPLVEEISYVIFDEIHFISDIERGTVWEESVIFSPEHIRFLCLSATIPNADEFAAWIESIKDHKVNVVHYAKRAVPLSHYIYDLNLGLSKADKLKNSIDHDKEFPDYYKVMRKRRKGRGRNKKTRFNVPNHIDIVGEIKKKSWLPCIFFTFSRKMCEKNAKDLMKKQDFASPEEKIEIIKTFRNLLDDNIKNMASVKLIRQLVSKGIAVHHAGILPNLKEIVEVLFSKGLIKVLYATETFAVGINMPAKCVCFNSLQKFDGVSFRYLNSKEYFQLAGRAGRRGIDKEGEVIALIDRNDCDIDKIIKFTSKDVDPIISQFKLSVNTVINLVDSHTKEDIERIMKSNFYCFQRKKEKAKINMMISFGKRIKKLKAMDYIDENGELTAKGKFARHIYSNELLVCESFADPKIYSKLSENQIIILAASIAYESRRGDIFRKDPIDQAFRSITKIIDTNQYIKKQLNKNNIRKMISIITYWSNGCEFGELLDMTNLLEGDIIRLFRQTIDHLRQIKRASMDHDLAEKIKRCIEKIDRDVIAVTL